MPLIGYARVSTDGQDTALQLDALRSAGCHLVFEEKASGASRKGRPVLEQCLGLLSVGDVLIVYRIDRIARSLTDLLAILDYVADSGAQIKSLSEPLDTTSPMGLFTVQVLGAVAQLERMIIRDRCSSGIAAAKARGVRFGRPPVLTLEQKEIAISLVADGYRVCDVARLLGVNYHTLWSSLNRLQTVTNMQQIDLQK